MKVNYLHISAMTLAIVLQAGSALMADATLADNSLPADQTANAQPAEAPKTPAAAPYQGAVIYPTATPGCREPIRDFALRLGGWGVIHNGSPNKVGEYQSLQSSPFWDADGIMSDGSRTLDFTATGNDNETTQGLLRYYGGPRFQANIEYERFLHELDRKFYPGFQAWPDAQYYSNNPASPVIVPNPPLAAPATPYTWTDRNPGRDPAIRVQEFKANFKGHITDDLKWKVDVFGMEKQGFRQANAVTHCYQAKLSGSALTTGNSSSQCHAISQMQHIDWRTTEVTPGLELRLSDSAVLEYSHMIRTFRQGDDIVLNDYQRAPGFGYSTAVVKSGTPPPPVGTVLSLGNNPNGTAVYGLVPNSTTQIDRLKLSAELGEDTSLYAMGYNGDSMNDFRDINRHFGGADLRVTNRSFEHLSITGYAKAYTEHTSEPTRALGAGFPYQEPNLSNIDPPVNRDTSALGATARWTPFARNGYGLWNRLALTAGYEYSQLRRTNVDYELFAGGNNTFVQNGVFVQPTSNRNMFWLGVEEKWSRSFDSYIRYKYIDTRYPLYGVSPDIGHSIDDALNTALPTREGRFEIGNTWTPTDYFMLTGTFYIEEATNRGPYANFGSNGYPFVLSAWYRATERWSLNCGYADFSNWINQDVTLAGIEPNVTAVQVPWRYTAKADVFNVGSSFAWTPKLILTSEFEYVRGLNASRAIVNPSQATPPVVAPNYDLGQYSRVSSNTYRIAAGVDYCWRPRVSTYFRYNFCDYADMVGPTSGEAHMFLGGFSAVY